MAAARQSDHLPPDAPRPPPAGRRTARSHRRRAGGSSTTGDATRLRRRSGRPSACAGRSPSAASSTSRGRALLVVINTRRFALAPDLHRARARRSARPPGSLRRPTRHRPFGPLLRRLGGLLADPAESRARCAPVSSSCSAPSRAADPRHAGTPSTTDLSARPSQPASRFPGGDDEREFGRAPASRSGPGRAPAANGVGPRRSRARRRSAAPPSQRLLDEFGGTRTGTPLDWLPLNGWAGTDCRTHAPPTASACTTAIGRRAVRPC